MHSEFVDKAITELCSSDRVIEVFDRPHVINPLSVSVQSNGKKRLILDLRHVNKCLCKNRVKYEDWKIAMASACVQQVFDFVGAGLSNWISLG